MVEVDASLPETQRLVRVYFTKVHPSWPILHQPTFEIEKASKCLVGSMAMNAAYHEGNEAHEKLARAMFSSVTGPELVPAPILTPYSLISLSKLTVMCRCPIPPYIFCKRYFFASYTLLVDW